MRAQISRCVASAALTALLASTGCGDSSSDRAVGDGGEGDGSGGRGQGSESSAAGGTSSGSGGRNGASGGSSPSTANQGLRVQGNRLLTPQGAPFRGRGANLFDTRSCEACTYLPPDVDGLMRWADELTDGWGANFVRFNLWSLADSEGWRQQWAPVTDDAGYLADVKTAVRHMTSKSGVYVMVTVFLDPSIKPNNDEYDSEWPTAETLPVYRALTEAFHDDPKVLFALTNEPHGPPERNAELAERYLAAIDAIREVERDHSAAEHVIVVQAPEAWARYLEYFVENPIERSNVAYEVHVYNGVEDFDRMLDQPSQTLPLIVGEHGPSELSDEGDIRALWQRCQDLEITHAAWSFHHRCPPNLLQDTAGDGCGLAASEGYTFPRTDWGNRLRDYLQTAW